ISKHSRSTDSTGRIIGHHSYRRDISRLRWTETSRQLLQAHADSVRGADDIVGRVQSHQPANSIPVNRALYGATHARQRRRETPRIHIRLGVRVEVAGVPEKPPRVPEAVTCVLGV